MERKAIEWGCMQALIWTSFERKKRREEAVVNDNVVVEDSCSCGGECYNKEEKPPVLREESGESIETMDSKSTDRSQLLRRVRWADRYSIHMDLEQCILRDIFVTIGM